MKELIPVKGNKVSVKDLYAFLELRAADFSRWFKSNIQDNQFAEENVDYKVFRMNAENFFTGGRPSKDAWLSIDFAKKALHGIKVKTWGTGT